MTKINLTPADKAWIKVILQPMKLVDCTSSENYKSLIEEIYNYRRSKKVNLRY